MLKRIFMTWLGANLAFLFVVAGCSSDGTGDGGSTGALEMSLDLVGDAQIDEVWYNITGNGMAPMSGLIDTSAPGATASVEVFGIPPGDDYLIELRAIVDDGTSCQGSAEFDVVAGLATPVSVMLNCKPPERFGSVRVNGKLNVCADLVKVVVAPLQTSVGSSIELSAFGVDAEGDPVSYLWVASGGPIADPEEPVTTYTCASPGQQFVRVHVSDDEFEDCFDAWEVELRCVRGDGGTGGTAGSGGSGGTAGSGGTTVICEESSTTCSNGDIDPTFPICQLPAPPAANDCVGNESLTNPPSCTSTANKIIVEVTQLEVNGDCNSGYDLDSCIGESCVLGGLAPAEGLDGIDNALAGLAPLLANFDGNLGGVNQAFSDGLCNGDIDIAFGIDVNVEENCAIVEVLADGVAGDPILMNLSDNGCLSGTIGTIPLNVAGEPGQMRNAVIRATLSAGGLSAGELGATVDAETAASIAEALLEGGGQVVGQVLDIHDDLSGDTSSGCDALSMTLTIGGARVGSSPEGACTDAGNAAVYANLEYTNRSGVPLSGTEAAAEISSDCVFGSSTSEPALTGCSSNAAEILGCAVTASCTPGVIEALSSCVEDCAQAAIAEVTGSRLSEECSSCYGASTSCSAVRCATMGCSNPNSSSCIGCRCEFDCIPAFDRCSGLPPSGQCE